MNTVAHGGASAAGITPCAWRAAFRRALPLAAVYGLLVGVKDFPLMFPFTSLGQLVLDTFIGEITFGVFLAIGVAVVEARERSVRARLVGYLATAVVANTVHIVLWEFVMSSLGYWGYKWPWWVRFWGNWGGSLIEALFAIALYRMWRNARDRAEALRAVQRTRAEVLRETAQADLLAMQARIDPTFLFDTLQAIERAYGARPDGGRRLIDALIDYLRAALPGIDAATSTLGKECDLARAELELARERYALDLRVAVVVDPAARAVPFPPMLVLPVVGDIVNSLRATRHAASATIRAAATRESATLAVELMPPCQPATATITLVRQRLAELAGGRFTLRNARILLEVPHGPRADR